MKQPLKGPHHFTGITRDVTTNVDFWCRVMGLRFVKNTLNFETTFRYHTYFGVRGGRRRQRRHVPRVQRGQARRAGRRRHPPDGPARRVLRLARVLDGPADRQPAPLGDAAAGSDAAAVARLLGPGEPRGRADGVRRDRQAAGRRRRRHPGRAPDPRARGRALVHDAGGATAVRGAPRLPGRTGRGSCSTASAPAAGTSPSRPGGRAATAGSASGTTSPTTRAPARRSSGRATRPTRASVRGRRSSTTTSSTAATRCLPEGGWKSARRGLDFSSTRSSKTSETASVSRLEWSRFAPSSNPS